MAMIKVNAKQLWNETVRKKAADIMTTCTSDSVLVQQLESMIVKIDTDILEGRTFGSRIEGVHNVLQSKTYYENAHKLTPDAEVAKIKEFADELAMLYKIASHEEKAAEAPVEEKQDTRQRLPNSDVDIEKIYGSVGGKGRIE